MTGEATDVPPPPPGVDPQAWRAAVDMIGNAGARQLTFGAFDDEPPEKAWWAKATRPGQAFSVERHPGPLEALEALVIRLLTGARCRFCGGLVALSDEGAMFYPGLIVNGREWTRQDAEAAGNCRWRRHGDRWTGVCQVPLDPEPGEEIHTTELLARALEQANDVANLGTLIRLAREGFFHDFLSPLPLPELELVARLRSVGHEKLAQRVINGEFDASQAESHAWGRSEEGQQTYGEFFDSVRTGARTESAKAKAGQAKRKKRPPKTHGRNKK